ncbi:glycoside hydrolase superfamily [Cladochytrium replicatum]|nr:glycoside hydrolase superfamily [Cladochytrium replicatum]
MKLFGVKKASSGSTLTIPIPPSLPAGFIFRKDHVLYEPLTDGTAVPLKFCSLNIPNLHALEDRPGAPGNWDIPTEWEQRDALKSVYLLGGKVARIYVISVGAAHRHVPQPGVYNDRMFQALDSALAIASEFGIKLILVCVDQWSWWGGIEQWAAFRNKRELQFWEDPTVRADFKHMLTYLVTRVNTKTGVRYCDDPTIFGWETTNEGGGWDYTPPADWTLDIARHIKSLDPHHLVIDGTLGGQTASGSPKWAKDVLESEGLVDVMTNHYYVCDSSLRDYARWAERDSKLAKKYRKAFFVGEYGNIETQRLVPCSFSYRLIRFCSD